MIQQKNILVIDTETCDLSRDVYDVGFTVTNKRGEIQHSFTGLVEENFENAKKMMGAFYAGKIFTHYARMLQDGGIRLMAWADIIAAIRDAVSTYDVSVIAAYNLGFDMRVMKNTHKVLGDGQSVLGKPMQILDLWQFACEVRLNNNLYRELAESRGWVSAAGNVKTGAEFAYRYITGNWDFIESHTALHDAEIETEILRACYAAKKRVPYGKVNGSPWMIVNRKAA